MSILDRNGNPIQSVPPVRVVRAPKRTAGGYYEAATYSRLRSNELWWTVDWGQTTPKGIRDILTAQARHLANNSGEMRGFLSTISSSSVGSGLTPKSMVKSDHIARQYEAYFTEWAEHADFTNGQSFWGMQRLVCESVTRDGDIGVAWVDGSRVQLFETQEIFYDGPEDPHIMDGIEYNERGEPIAFYTHVRDVRTGQPIVRRHIAGLFSLIFDQERVGQTRGVSGLAHGINDAKDFGELLTFAKMGLKQREAIGFVIYNEEGNADPLADPSATFRGQDIGYNAVQIGEGENKEDVHFNFNTVRPGTAPVLQQGQRIESLSDNRPSNAFADFIDTILSRIAAGMGIPLEFAWPARHSPTGPAQRSILARAAITFERRSGLIENRFCRPVWNWVIGQGILRGELRYTKGWQETKWSRPSRVSVDAGRDSQASIAELLAGTQTLEKDAEMRGLDWRAMREQRVREADDLLLKAKMLAERHDIDMGTAMGLLTDTKAAIQGFQPEPEEEPAEAVE